MTADEDDRRTIPIIDYGLRRISVPGDPVEYDGLEWESDGRDVWRLGVAERAYRLALRDPEVGDHRLAELQRRARAAFVERETVEDRVDILTRISDLADEAQALLGELEPATDYVRQDPVPIKQVLQDLAAAREELDSMVSAIADPAAPFIDPASDVEPELIVARRAVDSPDALSPVGHSRENPPQVMQQADPPTPSEGPGLG
ncbi:hypothetical protein OCAE111667_26755 [Occultella aeris]|uniref:Uncharacterized protein n=1 Tax=Occultella aeris TaxID=2761496 RepID=A0A7M4DJS6_9MICO|nr:hypothetical protein [Occultella aeris]VZO37311.1 hypothetical protein HALOF300_02384 [Occultella aeris]